MNKVAADMAIDAVLLDDEKSQLAIYGRALTEILSGIDPNVQVEQIEIKSTESIEEQTAKFEHEFVKRRPHILFVDNKFMTSDETDGQRLIERLKPRLPDTIFCLLTRQAIRSNSFGMLNPNPDLILSKIYLTMGEPNAYRPYVRELILERLKRSSRFSIEWVEPFDAVFAHLKDSKGRKVSIAEVRSVLEQVMFDGTTSKTPEAVRISPITGGRSGSVVLGCQLVGRLRYAITGVLKISSAAKAREEITNYNKYVKWVLPYTWRIDVIGQGFAENIGAICYSFAFEGQNNDPPKSASQLLKEGDESIVDRICQTIFDPARKTWYSQMSDCAEQMSAYFSSERFYKNKKNSKVEERENELIRTFEKTFGQDFQDTGDAIKLFGMKSERPTRLLLTEDWGKVEECISHGDLHCGNVLVHRDSGAIAFIDFQQTGFHFIYRDFVSVESSIRLDWPAISSTTDLKAALEDEVRMATLTDAPLNERYVELCRKVRFAAMANFPMAGHPGRHPLMLIGAYTHFSWLVTRFKDWDRSARQRLLLGAFGALVALQHLRDADSSRAT